MKNRSSYFAKRFGRWTVTDKSKPSYYNSKVACKCDCGTKKLVPLNYLLDGQSKSCGCLQKEAASSSTSRRNFRHGFSGTKGKIYSAWCSMRARCLNPKDANYKNYGARGIKICHRWNSFENFMEDMGIPPTKDHSLDRKDVNGPYNKRNCRWATAKQQMNNKRKTIYVTISKQKKSLAEWCDFFGTNYCTAWSRIQRGWSKIAAVMYEK